MQIEIFIVYIYNKRVFIKLNDSFICSRSLVDNLYCISLLSILPSNENYHVLHKMKEPITNQT